MKSLRLSLLVVTLFVFGLMGCETTQRLDSQQISIISLRNDVDGLKGQNRVINDRVDNLEIADQKTAVALDRLVDRLEITENTANTAYSQSIANEHKLAVVEIRMASVEVKNSEQDRRLSQIEAGVRNLRNMYGKAVTTAETIQPEFRGVVPISFGPFLPGNATPTTSISQLIETTKKSLGFSVINSVTRETVIESVIGFYDDAPIKKSGWSSNSDLGQARAQAVANALEFGGSVEIGNDPKRFGSRVDNRCVVVITRTTVVSSSPITSAPLITPVTPPTTIIPPTVTPPSTTPIVPPTNTPVPPTVTPPTVVPPTNTPVPPTNTPPPTTSGGTTMAAPPIIAAKY